MASERPTSSHTVLTLPGTNDVPFPPAEISWPLYPFVKDNFWERVRQAPVEAEVPFESRGSAGVVQSFQTLYRDHSEGHGVTIPPRSVLRMRMERSELPFSLMRFESKARRHYLFKTWAAHVLGQPDMKSFLEELGILRPIQNAMHADVERNQLELGFLVSRWSSHSHTFVAAWGEFCLSLEDVEMLTNLPLFGHTLMVDALDGEGEQLVEDLRASMSDAKYVTNKLTYLSWTRYFKEGLGITSPCHLAAFLVLAVVLLVSQLARGQPTQLCVSNGCPPRPKEASRPRGVVSWIPLQSTRLVCPQHGSIDGAL